MSRRGEYFTRSAGTIATDLRIRRTQFDGTLFLVEGPTDARALGQFVDRSKCQVVVGDTRDNVLTVVPLLRAEGFAGLVGLVDADFSHLQGTTPRDPDVLVTDEHDLEMMLLRSNALDRVLWARGSADRLQRAHARWGSDLRPALLATAAPLGALRLYAQREGEGWTFKHLNYESFLNLEALAVFVPELCQEVKNKTQRPSLDISRMAKAIDTVLAEGLDLWQLCRGHDVLEILSVALRKYIGSQRPTAVNEATLSMDLALAYDKVEFVASPLFVRTRAWEAQNPGYKVLAT